jgi:signal transduction histidine kinase
LGFDLASNPARLEALNEARDTGKPVATARITLVQEADRQFAFLVFVPVYPRDLPHDRIENRSESLIGFALGVFRVGDVVKESLKDLERSGIEVGLFDESAPAGERTLFVDNGGAQISDLGTPVRAGPQWISPVPIAGRNWVVRITPTAKYLALRETWTSWTVPAGGLMFTGVLCAFLLIVTGRSARIEQLVDARTAELSEANLRLEEHTGELTHSNAELEQFAYIASHDLQEPLRMVSSYVGLLESRYKDKLDQDANDFIGFAVDGAKRTSALIRDMLQLSLVGTTDVPFAPADCERAFQEAIINLGVAIEESGAIVEHEPLPEVIGDLGQLTQLFQNLAGNAIKFRSDESPKVLVSAKRTEEAWTFSVKDNGIGIDTGHSQRIFQIFQRLHKRGEYSGTGMGLAMCKKIAERHGGRIWVESAPGMGSTLLFSIPTERKANHE